MHTLDDYKKLVADSELAQIDIGAVFLNAGVLNIGPFDLISSD